MTTTRYLTSVALLLTLALVAGCGGANAPSGGEPAAPIATTVQVVDNDFEPRDAGLTAGDTLTWQWESSSQHNVVGDGFESPVQDGGTFEHTFTEPGTYEYHCTLHRGMRGTVTVGASDGTGG